VSSDATEKKKAVTRRSRLFQHLVSHEAVSLEKTPTPQVTINGREQLVHHLAGVHRAETLSSAEDERHDEFHGEDLGSSLAPSTPARPVTKGHVPQEKSRDPKIAALPTPAGHAAFSLNRVERSFWIVRTLTQPLDRMADRAEFLQ
jgi:hypothetical protein